MAKNKEHRIINNQEMIFESALNADFSILRAHKVDTYGNCRFYRTSQNFSKAMAMAGKVTIVEALSISNEPVSSSDE